MSVAGLSGSDLRVQRIADDARHRVSMLEYEVTTLRRELDRIKKDGTRQDCRLDACEMRHTAGVIGGLQLVIAVVILIAALGRPEARLGTTVAIPFLVAGAWTIAASSWWSRATR